jgi:glycine/D-amino acid oxidase-like deaminating enzyme
MKKVDYIVVGDGYAALFLAHQLIANNKTFVIYSAGQKGASRVSAGVVNPVVLKKFTTFWLAKEQIDFLKITMKQIENYTGRNHLVVENIHRIFHDEKEKELWQSKSGTGELKTFLDPNFEEISVLTNPYGTGKVNQSARINVKDFFEDFFKYVEGKGMLVKEEFIYDQVIDDRYQDYQFKNLVFCEGMGVRNNPFFKTIPVIPNKGHHLKVRLSEKLDNQYTIKKKHFLFPLNEEFYYYGGTYDPNERENKIDDFSEQKLVEGLSEFYTPPFEIAEINYGFRPTVKDRRPILGNHSEHSNYYIFNGLGGRGILNGCYFSKLLYEHIENGKPLMPEVDLKRFEK